MLAGPITSDRTALFTCEHLYTCIWGSVASNRKAIIIHMQSDRLANHLCTLPVLVLHENQQQSYCNRLVVCMDLAGKTIELPLTQDIRDILSH